MKYDVDGKLGEIVKKFILQEITYFVLWEPIETSKS